MRRHPRRPALLAGLLLLLAPRGGAAAGTAAAPAQEVRTLELEAGVFQGDLDAILERRTLRILVPYSRSLYFTDKGKEEGLVAGFARDLERFLNEKHRKRLGKRPLTVFAAITPRDRLLSDVAAGRGDLAVANLTITPERERVLDFVPLADRRVDELLVTGPRTPPIADLEDLAGKTVHARPSSSYHASLVALRERFAREGRPPLQIVRLPEALEDEDALEMLNAGLLDALVVDDWKARLWAQVLPRLRVRSDVVLRAQGRIGWGIRPGSPKLAAEIRDFHAKVIVAQHNVEARVAALHRRVRRLKDPSGPQAWRRFGELVALFEKYGERYGFDPLMLAAQGFQESTLDQSKKSPVGAIGVMQLMPATGESLHVGDVRVTENNIHAGAKYLDQLIDQHFSDAEFPEGERTLFAFASYNAGAARIARLRAEAARRGLDPNRWFDNVEVVAAAKIGRETVTYVRNIYKYYVAYALEREAKARQAQARGAVGPRPPG